MIPYVHGHAFSLNNGNSYRCRYHKKLGCPVTICVYSETEYRYSNGSLQEHVEKHQDYINDYQRQVNKEAAKDSKYAGMTATEIQKEVEIKGVTKRKSTLVKQVERYMDIKPTPKSYEEIDLTEEERKKSHLS